MTRNTFDSQQMVGAVIVFTEGTSVEKAQKFLNEMAERGILQYEVNAREFDSRYGGPVWYIP